MHGPGSGHFRYPVPGFPMLRLALALGAALARIQELPPAAGEHHVEPAASGQEAQPALDERDRALLELVRAALEDGDRDGARELLREELAALQDPEPGREAPRAAFLVELDRIARELGLLEESRRLCEAVVELRASLPADHADVLRAKADLAVSRKDLGDLAGALALEKEVHEARLRLLPADHPDLLAAKSNLAATMWLLGDVRGAHALFEEVHAARTRLVPADDHDLLQVELNLAVTRRELGDLPGAHALFEHVVETWSRLLPADHADLLRAKQNLAMTTAELGDLPAGRALFEDVHEALTRTLPADHPDLIRVKMNLAVVRAKLGDVRGARPLLEEVVEAWARLLPADHPDLVRAKGNLAAARNRLGDSRGARVLFEELLECRARALPADHPELISTKLSLAVTMYELGDLAGARALFEDVLVTRRRLLPAEHSDLLRAQENLAGTMFKLGDLPGALALYQEVLDVRTRRLPEDHPELLMAQTNLAGTLHALGDVEDAHALFEEVLAAWSQHGTPDSPDVLEAQRNLAQTCRELGDLPRARALEEEVLATWSELLPAGHPDLLRAQGNLALTREALGDLAGARVLEEEVLAAWTRGFPADHPDLLEAQRNLAWTCRELGDRPRARALVSSLLAGMRARAQALRSDAVRAAREGALVELERFSEALFLGGSGEGAPEAELFATLESLRLASVASSDVARALDRHPELAGAAREIAELRSRLNDLVAAGAEGATSAEQWREELLSLAGERDRAERELRSRLAGAGLFVGEIDAAGVGTRLAPGSAAASFFRYSRRTAAPGESEPAAVDSLLAFLVRPGGAVERIELGPAAELERLVEDWRAALGRPLGGRGIATGGGAGGEGTAETLGRLLRESVLDPVLASAGEVRTLHVVLDDLLHLVPLDALPLENGLVGDRMAVRNEISLGRLLRPPEEPAAGGGLTLAGGIDYEAEIGPDASVRLEAGASPMEARDLRSASGSSGFASLPGTTAELESIAALYREAFEREARTLTRGVATKAALHAAAPGTRYLHLATHGWFAPESFRSELDAPSGRGSEPWRRAGEAVVGFAPETLCGLALAGANRGRDSLGRVPGILTAEELASLDLGDCELAVLSACETNVGLRRAGQGIQSLQAALHAAGARTAITSLWKVDDEATRRLFELFYARLWKERLGKSTALWQAKMALRAEGHPLRDWAGWVLSGDPD